MKRLFTSFAVLTVPGLVALAILLVPASALAYSSADFINPRTIRGGEWLGQNTAQHNSYEPLNVIISARSDNRVKNDPTTYLNAVRFSDCFGGQVVKANVDGTWRGQAFEYRDGGCGELFGGNHLRGWKQAQTGAWFLAVSEEHGPPWAHHIDSNGFNKGRDDLAAKVNGTVTAPLGRYNYVSFRTTEETVPGCAPSPTPKPPSLYCAGTGSGNTDGVPYDGKVIILTVQQIH